ncbi:MAG: dynamin family protein [Acidimicrobiia bacterium]
MSASAERAPLHNRVAGLMNALVSTSTEAGRPDVAERIGAEAKLWSRRTTTVVVAGEANQGKSALLNALLDGTVVASGAHLVTDTYVVVRHDPEPHALVHLSQPAESLTIGVEEAPHWMADQGLDRSRLEAVEVLIDHPMLAGGLVLVDTPGVGGLDAAQARITLDTLARADALVFVTDASAPLSQPELRFLQQAADRIETVLFAITRIDRYRGWRSVVEEDRDLLRRHAPRFAFAPMVPVSPQLKKLAGDLEALGTPDPALVDESGLAALESELRTRVCGRTETLRLGNIMRVAHGALATLRADLEASAHRTDSQSGAQEQAARHQDELDALRDAAERAQVVIADGFGALRETVAAELGRAWREITERYESGRPPTADELLRQLQTDLRAVDTGLQATIEEEAARLAALAAEMVDAPAPVLVRGSDGPMPDLELDGLPGKSEADSAMRLRFMSTLASTGTGLGLFVSRLGEGPELIGALLGAGTLVGVVTAAVNLRLTRRQHDVQAMRTNLRTAMDVARAEMTPALRQRVLQLQRAVEAGMKAHVKATTRRLQGQIVECQHLARSDALARQQARAAAEQRLAGLGKLEATAKALRRDIDALPASPRASGPDGVAAA